MDRRKAREAVMQLLFEREFQSGEPAVTTLSNAVACRDLSTDHFTESMYYGIVEHMTEIDEHIKRRAIGWRTDRMTKVSLSLLRIGVYEMVFGNDIPFAVSINEAVELAKQFDDEKAPAFVNGILNGVAEDLGLKADS